LIVYLLKCNKEKKFKPKKKLLGGLLTAAGKQAAKSYFKSGGRRTGTIMKKFGGTRTEAKTDVLSGFEKCILQINILKTYLTKACKD
jgi:hypothetical protein